MAEEFFVHEFDNGLTLVAQRMSQMSSVAVTIALPAGAAYDSPDSAGSAAVARNWLFRGAGERDTRALNDALDALGCQHSESVRSRRMVLDAALLGKNLPELLAIYADILRRPALPDEGFEPCRDLTQQALEGLADEPMRLCNLLIREKFFPSPLGRSPYGSVETLAGLTAEGLREHVRRRLTPSGTILAVAGSFEWDVLQATIGELLGDWTGEPIGDVAVTDAPRGVTHLAQATAQVQITLAYDAPIIRDDAYYPARIGQMVLSGGMGSRLFTEVREKRGLVYSVGASYHTLRDHAGLFTHAGTRPDLAQETFDVTLGELRRLGEGIGPGELERAKTQIKSALVMQGESTAARAAALAADWYHLGRLRPLAEIAGRISDVTAETVISYTEACPARRMTVLIMGPEPVDASAAVED